MKRIEFIAPVESMRGNLSGAQKLEYPTENLGAYDSVPGNVNYAKNYSARFIGAKVARTGKKYFSVRTKSANHLTAKSKKAMALLGGTGALVGAILANKSGAYYTGIVAQYEALTELGMKKSLRKYMSEIIRAGLESKQTFIAFSGPRTLVQVPNPWITYETLPHLVSDAILVKFWDVLAANGTYFTVDGATGINDDEDFNYIVGNEGLNVLSLTTEVVGSSTYVKRSGAYLIDEDGEYVTANVEPASGQKFTTIINAPSA